MTPGDWIALTGMALILVPAIAVHIRHIRAEREWQRLYGPLPPRRRHRPAHGDERVTKQVW